MKNERTYLVERVIALLEEEVAGNGMALHESFKIELLNYSRHVKVEDLPDEQLNLVLGEIGSRAISRAREKRRARALEVPGEDVRNVIMELCTTWEDCYEAARKILETESGQIAQ